MSAPIIYALCGIDLCLLPERAIYLPESGCLLIADLHLGKAAHFRKSGIAVPIHAELKNFEILAGLLENYRPTRVVFLGDLFHSHQNEIWALFTSFLGDYRSIQFDLVVGNHDILSIETFAKSGLKLSATIEMGGILLSHERVETGLYNLHGHLHPAVRLKGQGRLRTVLPCFYFGEKHGVLPAFGAFTGSSVIIPKKGDAVFVLAHNAVVQMA